jgi:hypothetical protein
MRVQIVLLKLIGTKTLNWLSYLRKPIARYEW